MRLRSQGMGPLRIHAELPATSRLRDEGLWVESTEGGHARDPAQTMRVCVVNIMPLKQETELQLCRMLARAQVPVDVTWCVPDAYAGKNSAPGHIQKYYSRLSEVLSGLDADPGRFDAFIVTGAPVEHLEFSEIKYWRQLCALFDRIQKYDLSLLTICWGAMAATFFFYALQKVASPSKIFGVFEHDVLDPTHTLVQALPSKVGIPVSRHCCWRLADVQHLLRANPRLKMLMNSPLSGPGLLYDEQMGHTHIINHFEYDVNTLDGEYRRDLKRGTPTGEQIHVPHGYYPNDDPGRPPEHSWKAPGQVT